MLESKDPSQWTLDRVFRARVRASPDAPFLESAQTGEILSFQQAFERAGALAARLAAHGIAPQQRVGLMASNSLAALNCWFALNLAGATDVSINPASRGQVLEYLVGKADISVLIVEPEYLPQLLASEDALPGLREVIYFQREGDSAAPPQVQPRRLKLTALSSLPRAAAQWSPPAASGGDVASVLFTSGTSGPSKGVMVTHAHALLSARSCVQGARMTPADTLYCFHPFFHMAAKHCGILSTLLAGSRVVVERTFDPTTWLDSVRRHGATLSLGHGPMLEMIFQQPARPDDGDSPLTRVVCAPMPRHIAREFEQRFGVLAIEIWGMSEIGLPCWRPCDEPLLPGSCGPVLSEWYEVRVADPVTGDELPRDAVGELRVRPKHRETVMAGYLADPGATQAAWSGEWFCTGDSGIMDENGWVYVLDRMTDRIRRRGENISPADIERAAGSHPTVFECVAVGVPSGFVSDDDVKLCVVARPGQVLDPFEMTRWLTARLPHFMVPRYIEVLPQLPRTPTNKVRRSELRKSGVGAGTWDRKAAGVSLRQLVEEGRGA
jgi:carnitine-CoA ligase